MKTINIEDFYTEANEAKGMWHEPVIDGEPCGLKFLIIGIHSAEAVNNMVHYDKLVDKLKEEEDEDVRAQKEKEIDAERIASITKDIKGSNGETLMKDGKEIEINKESIKELYLNAPLLKMDIVEFALKTSNFMKKSED